MKDDLKEYRDILIILNKQSKPESKHNKLLKIQLSTEDTRLKTILPSLVEGYRLYIPPRYSRTGYPGNHTEWVESMKPLKEMIENYVEGVLDTKKPQWKILAERNGWAPIIRRG